MTAPLSSHDHDHDNCVACYEETYRQAKADPVAAIVLDALRQPFPGANFAQRALDAAAAIRTVFGRSPAAEYREANELRFRVEDLADNLDLEVATVLTTDLQAFDARSFRLGHTAGTRSAVTRTAADLRRILAEGTL